MTNLTARAIERGKLHADAADLLALTDPAAARAHAETTELLVELGTFVVEMRNALTRPTHHYGDKKFPMVPTLDFLADAYDEDLADELRAILKKAGPA